MPNFETCSILVPIRYPKEEADTIILQMGKRIDKMIVVGEWYNYRQFKPPQRCLKKIQLVGDIKLLQVLPLYF